MQTAVVLPSCLGESVSKCVRPTRCTAALGMGAAGQPRSEHSTSPLHRQFLRVSQINLY